MDFLNKNLENIGLNDKQTLLAMINQKKNFDFKQKQVKLNFYFNLKLQQKVFKLNNFYL